MSSTAAISPSSSHSGSGCPTPSEIDASFRLPALVLALKSVGWLLFGSVLLLLASVKLHGPGMMADKAWLTYGRILPAGWDALVYGFAGQAGILSGLWVLARACGQRLQAAPLVCAATVIWNLATLAGVAGILAGYSTGREWLEMPAGAMAGLVVAGALFGVSGWMTYAARTRASAYPSAWFVLLAVLAFVWFGSATLSMLAGDTAHGVIQVLIQRWFTAGVVRLWLGGLALAVIFHFLPALVDRPLASRQLALIGFWCLTFFAPFTVARHGDPFPRWLVSVGIAAGFLASVAWLASVLNWWKTAEGRVGWLMKSPTGRLVGAAAGSYALAGLLQFALSLRSVSSVLRMTWAEAGVDWLAVGAALLALLAALPVVLERATGKSLSASVLGLHSTLTIAGVALTALPLVLSGLILGSKLGGGTATFLEALRGSMHGVRLSTLGLLLLFAGQGVLAWGMAQLFRRQVAEWLGLAVRWTVPVTTGKTAGVRS